MSHFFGSTPCKYRMMVAEACWCFWQRTKWWWWFSNDLEARFLPPQHMVSSTPVILMARTPGILLFRKVAVRNSPAALHQATQLWAAAPLLPQHPAAPCSPTGQRRDERLNTSLRNVRIQAITFPSHPLCFYGLCCALQSNLLRRRRKIPK